MSRSVTAKNIQVHEECSCGHNEVYEVKKSVRFKDLAAAGIRYKKDMTTGEWFFMQHIECECDGSTHNDY